MFKKIFLFLIIICCSVSAQTSYRSLSTENWTFNKQNETRKYKATVPGTIHTDLFQQHLIPDPFYGANEKKLQWIENESWEYETIFSVSNFELSAENIELEFNGLDTYATVFLNGNSILEADNMFRKWTLSVKNRLKKGKNQLKIVFHSAVQKGKEAATKLPYTLPERERVFIRKAQYQFGWDWGPRFVTAGIWKNVQLKFWNSAKIENIKYSQLQLNEEKALLEFITDIYSPKEQTVQLALNDKVQTFHLKKGKNIVKMPYEILKPIFWWCNGLGKPHLYSFSVELFQQNKLLESKKLNIGLRTIELVQNKDTFGTGFYFKLNGKPVFMKGANYVPNDSFLPRVSKTSPLELVLNAKAAHMNMLRVWGGGVYADDAFYDACDANGILVWQDFMFACSMYPGDDKFVANVKQEVIDQVDRLQNHPSLALWCGNNENDEGWHNWGWQKQYNYSKSDSTQIWNDYKKVFHELIPHTLDSLLSKDKNSYWPSSPSIGWGRKESLLQGDSHYWGVWWGKEPFEMYQKKVGRFMSEYGFQGMPNKETLERVIAQSDLNFGSEVFKNHQKHPTGFETINEYMARDFRVPIALDKYIYVSQLLQAYGMKTAIEAHRLAKPYCMGSLYWQFNDCWPVTSWSTVDYYGNWKASHYQVKESFAPIVLLFSEDAKALSIIGSNDTFDLQTGTLTAQLLDFSGNVIWKADKICEINQESNTVCLQIEYDQFPNFDKQKSVLQVEFKGKNTESVAYHYFVKPKELLLEKPTIEIKVVGETLIEVTTNTLAKNVYLHSKDGFFNTNYFDLIPGFPKIIKIDKPSNAIEVLSLFDAN
ncbi:glycosyl hydrolase 2 galactose-binding domain-containing protein [Flavobacterium sp.]|jgi:beta-mannosidase|uniref:beta-mannosidase n=1 Tax=Flavobacterium sp. TaxID=239 RepID=UPI0037BE7B77